MKLRYLTEDDFAEFKELRLEGLKSHPKSYMHIYDEESKRPDVYWKNMLKSNWIIGATKKKQLVGFAIMTPCDGIKQRHKATVWGAYVKEEFRNGGIGKSMRLELFEKAKTYGMTHVTSAIVGDNPASLGMHLSVGYEQMYIEKRGLRHRDNTYSDIIHLIRLL